MQILLNMNSLRTYQFSPPVHRSTLSADAKKAALHPIDLIKEKRTGKLKGRTVADGRKQRPLYNKHEISSPALSQDGFMGSLAIDAYENCYIGIADIAGAFLKVDQNDHVIVKSQGLAVDALIKINPEKYKKFMVYEKKTELFMSNS